MRLPVPGLFIVSFFSLLFFRTLCDPSGVKDVYHPTETIRPIRLIRVPKYVGLATNVPTQTIREATIVTHIPRRHLRLVTA